jgi:hypothetical protein
VREYTRLETFVNNLPYILMIGGGAALVWLALDSWAAGAAYAVYGAAGAAWIMLFVCPYCAYYDSRACPCGYGKISAGLRAEGPRKCFSDKFRKHIPVIVPLWLIPVGVAGVRLGRSFSWDLLIYAVLFAAHSFVVLPLVSTRHGCTECPQRNECPWMGKGGEHGQRE